MILIGTEKNKKLLKKRLMFQMWYIPICIMKL